MAAKNPWEATKRREKVAAMVARLDLIVEMCGLNPARDSFLVLGVIRKWDDEKWDELAVSAGKTPPSAETKRLVIEALEARGQRRAG